MARGNERRAVFFGDEDRKVFLATVGEMVERFGARVMAYCLMPNHYHLVIGTPRGNLSAAVGWLQLTYTARFNARHRRSGHLFQGRFKAQLVEADEYGRWLVEYVHLNPVRPRRKTEALAAERARELDRFEWSSHRDYAGLRAKAAEWLCLDWLAYWGKKGSEAQEAYRAAMRRWFAGEKTSPWEQLRGQLVLGGEELWKKTKRMIQKKQGTQEARWTKEQTTAVLRERVRDLVAAETDDQVKIWGRVRLGGERPVDVARKFGYRHQSGVGQVIKRLEEYAKEDAQLRSKLEQLKAQVCSVES
jgi:REP element-mobilizing transposase RayT